MCLSAVTVILSGKLVRRYHADGGSLASLLVLPVDLMVVGVLLVVARGACVLTVVVAMTAVW